MRRLTVSKMFQPRRRGGTQVPHIRLLGQWLEAAGFTAGRRVSVSVQAGQLVITPAE